jgi:hypothetical protein
MATTELRRVCAWCKREKGDDHRAVRPVLTVEQRSGATDGICDECRDKHFPGSRSTDRRHDAIMPLIVGELVAVA